MRFGTAKNPELALQTLDMLAWEATCEWHSRLTGRIGSFDADYIELTRWFLWDKVGRAIRISSGSQSSVLEKKLMEAANGSTVACSAEPNFISKQTRILLSRFFQLVKKKQVQHAPNGSSFQRRNGPLVYVPVLSDRLKKAVSGMTRENICQVAVRYAPQLAEGVDIFQPNTESDPDMDTATYIYDSIVDGLKGFGITLLDGDAVLLRSQIISMTAHVNCVHLELEKLKPNAILVHGDNHPPFQTYVMAARKMGIPAIMLQHGLDCEHRYLDEAYASAIAVWGPERAQRYRERSNFQPIISVTGNPEYDHLQEPEKIDASGDYWLWVTRPHTPEKCYAPSRTPDEGITIFYSLIEALQKAPGVRLIIKSHPYDYSDKYIQIIKDQGLQDRVCLSVLNVHYLIKQASLVITEDSSAGLDAMLAGKPLVHAHFAESKPTMPFVDYGAALPGFSTDQLVKSILRADALDETEAQDFLSGQNDFRRDFAGLCDGKSGKRFVDFVLETLCQK